MFKHYLRTWKSGVVVAAIAALTIFATTAAACKPQAGASCDTPTGNVAAWVMLDKMPVGSTAKITAHVEGGATGVSIDKQRFEEGQFIIGSQDSILKPGDRLTWNLLFSDHATGFVRVVIDSYVVTMPSGKVVSQSKGPQVFYPPVLTCIVDHPFAPPAAPPVIETPPAVVIPPAPPVVVITSTPYVPSKPAPPRVSIAKSASPLRAGNLGWYRINITTLDDAKQVIVRDRLPDGLTLVDTIKGMTIFNGVLAWNLGPMRANQTISLFFRVKVDTNVQPHRLCNTARARATGGKWVSDSICVRTTQPPTVFAPPGPTG